MALFTSRAAGAALLALGVHAAPAAAQHQHHHHDTEGTLHADDHAMFRRALGGGWQLLGMAQAFPIVTTSIGSGSTPAVGDTEFYLTQPAVMVNVESPRSRVTLRTTLNFEGLTLEHGEITFGGWGEGFIDRRHPHTLLHEAVLSVNLDGVAGGALSLSGGKGFAPYGTDDPMARPVVKFPTNHHLSQILERFVASAAWWRGPWSVEAGIFGGSEPTGPYDLSNIESFGNSWSARVVRRFGGTPGFGAGVAPWEVAASFGRVVEEHHGVEERTDLVNAYVRMDDVTRLGRVYALVEASRSMPEGSAAAGFYSVLAEARLTRGGHRPYVRLEVATRPEYEREGEPGTRGFFRYDHDDHDIGATRWVITTVGYGRDLTGLPWSVRPFVEAQHNNVASNRGDVTATELFGTSSFFSVSAGFRVYLGGGPMRMGAYGVLDPMTGHALMPW